MFFDEFGPRNLRFVSLSSMVSAAIQDERICVRLDSIPGLAVAVIGINVHLSASRAIRRGCSSRTVGANGAHSSNPTFSFENR
jgi:hypothetical protein